MTRTLILLAFALSIVLTSGCATNTSTSPVYDPYESINRKIHILNTDVDKALLEPAARTYRFLIPDPIEDGVSNVFNNIDDVTVFVNAVLQGKIKQAASDAGRFLVNSTIGIAGIFDVGTRMGLPKHNDSFGQTLGVWGVGEGPFIMLPLLGPANGRAAVGRVVDGATSYLPPYLTDEPRVLNTTRGIGIIDTRARFLSAGKLLDDALDPYQLLRDIWVKNHREQTFEGKREVSLGEDFDEFEEFDDEDDEDFDEEDEDLDEEDDNEELTDSSTDDSSTTE